MADPAVNKATIQQFLQTVWREGNLDALGDYWTNDCVNHAAGAATGLGPLRSYHESFLAAFQGVSNVQLELNRQIAEGDMVMTYITTTADHTGDLLGVPATGRTVQLHTMRIDRLHNGRIAEHWSLADMAGLAQQLQP
jgi:predicted ester cyclase